MQQEDPPQQQTYGAAAAVTPPGCAQSTSPVTCSSGFVAPDTSLLRRGESLRAQAHAREQQAKQQLGQQFRPPLHSRSDNSASVPNVQPSPLPQQFVSPVQSVQQQQPYMQQPHQQYMQQQQHYMHQQLQMHPGQFSQQQFNYHQQQQQFMTQDAARMGHEPGYFPATYSQGYAADSERLVVPPRSRTSQSGDSTWQPNVADAEQPDDHQLDDDDDDDWDDGAKRKGKRKAGSKAVAGKKPSSSNKAAASARAGAANKTGAPVSKKPRNQAAAEAACSAPQNEQADIQGDEVVDDCDDDEDDEDDEGEAQAGGKRNKLWTVEQEVFLADLICQHKVATGTDMGIKWSEVAKKHSTELGHDDGNTIEQKKKRMIKSFLVVHANMTSTGQNPFYTKTTKEQRAIFKKGNATYLRKEVYDVLLPGWRKDAQAVPAATVSVGIGGDAQMQVPNAAGAMQNKKLDPRAGILPSKYDHTRHVSVDRSKGAAAVKAIDNLVKGKADTAAQVVEVERRKCDTMANNGDQIAGAIREAGIMGLVGSVSITNKMTPDETLAFLEKALKMTRPAPAPVAASSEAAVNDSTAPHPANPAPAAAAAASPAAAAAADPEPAAAAAATTDPASAAAAAATTEPEYVAAAAVADPAPGAAAAADRRVAAPSNMQPAPPVVATRADPVDAEDDLADAAIDEQLWRMQQQQQQQQMQQQPANTGLPATYSAGISGVLNVNSTPYGGGQSMPPSAFW